MRLLLEIGNDTHSAAPSLRPKTVSRSVEGWQRELKPHDAAPHARGKVGAELLLLNRLAGAVALRAGAEALRPGERQARELMSAARGSQLLPREQSAGEVAPTQQTRPLERFAIYVEGEPNGFAARFASQPRPNVSLFLQPGASAEVAADLHARLAAAGAEDLAALLERFLDNPQLYKGARVRACRA